MPRYGRWSPIRWRQILSAEIGTDAARPVLVVHPSPGDESLFTGGTLALLADAGSAVTVLICAADPADDTETAEAMRALGIVDHRVLGRAGARIAGAPSRRYAASDRDSTQTSDALAAADPAEVAADIATVIATIGARAVIGPVEDGDLEHPDRRVTGRAARRAAEVMGVPYYPVVTDAWADSEAVDVTSVLDRKTAAVAAYRRFTLDGDVVVLDDGARMPVTAVERFGTGNPRRGLPGAWSELRIGGRIAALIAALLLGVVVAALGTVTFQATVVVFGQPLPTGLVAALLIVAGILAGLRLVTGTRLVPAAAAVGVLGVVALLSQESQGGSVLVPASPLSYYWVYGPVVIAFVVLAWPDLHRRERVRIAEAQNRKEHPQP